MAMTAWWGARAMICCLDKLATIQSWEGTGADTLLGGCGCGSSVWRASATNALHG